MQNRRWPVSTAIALAIGLVLGFVLASVRPSAVRATNAESDGQSIAFTAPISTEANQALKVQLSHDAVYFLNYSTGRLMASIPVTRQTTNATQVLSDFEVRDLVRDFELRPGTSPHFLITTGTLGAMSEGWAPVYVFETTTGQYAVYRVMPQATATSTKPRILLLEKRSNRLLADHVSAPRGGER
jgi:hypothetical protein